jgi:superoxide dismutase
MVAFPAAVKRDRKWLGRIRKRFVGEATRNYGSGWLWLVSGDHGLRIMTTRIRVYPYFSACLSSLRVFFGSSL